MFLEALFTPILITRLRSFIGSAAISLCPPPPHHPLSAQPSYQSVVLDLFDASIKTSLKWHLFSYAKLIFLTHPGPLYIASALASL